MARPTISAAFLAACSPLSLLPAQLPSFVPTTSNVILDTDFAVVQASNGQQVTVVGGVFVFHDVIINQGVTVQGQGSNPLVFVLTGRMQVAGELSVRGGDGARGITLNAANFPNAGGRAGPAGGAGGAGSPQTAARSYAGQAGNGPLQGLGLGGTGGLVALPPTQRGSGGGGGAFATAGDPYYGSLWAGGTAFVQQLGLGGYGGLGVSGAASRTLPGGGPGGGPFGDGVVDNDFFGYAVDVFRGRIVVGELPLPTGGAGGGGGGDQANTPLGSPVWINDGTGGGGGGGGGCLVVYAVEDITVADTGRVTANGGNGGGGAVAGSSSQGGGGGAGAGGMIILASEDEIELHVKGETYANLDYDFVLSADGGICTTGTFAFPIVLSKYPPNGVPTTMFGPNYDAAPLGGFGGLGVIQLVTPPGDNSDGTNTVLDDNVVLFRNGQQLAGATKQRYLAWRGFDDGNGVLVDDFGNPTNVGSNAGDMRPTPVLMPLIR